MRYFTLRVFISDMRCFHAPHRLSGDTYEYMSPVIESNVSSETSKSNLLKSIGTDVVNMATSTVKNILNIKTKDKENEIVFLRIMYNWSPIHEIKCTMCDIDIT